jgi:hypothetical protein
MVWRPPPAAPATQRCALQHVSRCRGVLHTRWRRDGVVLVVTHMYMATTHNLLKIASVGRVYV